MERRVLRGKLGRLLLAGATVLAATAAAWPLTVSAQPTTASASVVAGSLALLSVEDVDFGTVNQDGSDHTPTSSARYDVSDATASGAGWHLSISGTPFTDGRGHVLPTANAESASSACDNGSTCTLAANQVVYPLGIPDDGSTVTLFAANADSGKGNQTATVNYSEYLSPAAASGFYRATWSISLSSAP